MPPIKGKVTTEISTRRRLGDGTWYGILLSVVFFVGSIIGIYLLSIDARRETQALAVANSDSTQWALAQSEVELLAVLNSISLHQTSGDQNLRDIRRKFDVFYSRIATMQKSSVLAGLREMPAAIAGINEVKGILDDIVPIMDGTDDQLVANLPEIFDRISDARPAVRAVSLAGVSHFSETSDEQRHRVTTALLRLEILTFILVAALALTILALIKSARATKRDALEMARTQNNMSVIVSTSLDAIVVADLEGRVVEFNKSAETIFGFTRSEIVGQKLSETIIPDKYREAHETGMERHIKTREKRVVGQGRIQLEAKHKNGRVFPIEFSISSAEGADGEFFVSYMRDISRRVAEQEELVQARDEAVAGERAKAELVAVMSHEMRTPLNGIIGALELMNTTKLDKTQANMAEIMDTSANMLLRHVNDVLDMSRLDSDKVENIQRPYNPIKVASELLESLKMPAKKNGNTLNLSTLDPNFQLVMGDPDKLRQLLTNLVGNAIKFTKHGKITVEIEPHRGDGQWEVRVSDEGIGISEENQKRVFDAFVTLDPSYTRAQEGTGLGLAIVRRLVEHLDGEIGVESELGKGTLFWVKLPMNIDPDSDNSDFAIAGRSEVEHQAQDERQKTILLVEDNAINRVVAREMIQRLGHTVIEAHNGAEGVELSEMQSFDAIFMDISMPVMDGVEATQKIRSKSGPNRNTPIYAVTAHAMPEDISRFIDAGMVDVVVKPLSIEKLSSALSSFEHVSTEKDTKFESLNIATIVELSDEIGREKTWQLVRSYVEEMDSALLAKLAMNSDIESETLGAEAHRLAGSSSIFGAHRVRARLIEIEKSENAQGNKHRPSQLQALHADWERTRSEIVTAFADEQE